MAEELPREVRDLVSRRLNSMEEVEVLLLLAAEPGALTSDEIRERLRLTTSSAALPALARLEREKLIVAEGQEPPRYRYAPESGELRRAVALLAVAYNERPVTLVRLVYTRPNRAQTFADAFRIVKDDEK